MSGVISAEHGRCMTNITYTQADPAEAPVGSFDWALLARGRLQSALNGERIELDAVEGWYRAICEHHGWRVLVNRQGKHFQSLDEFCRHPRPEGLQLERAALEARIERVKKLAGPDGVANAAKHGRPTKAAVEKGAHSTFSRGTTHVAYLVAA
jgi:hypothetical protein